MNGEIKQYLTCNLLEQLLHQSRPNILYIHTHHLNIDLCTD